MWNNINSLEPNNEEEVIVLLKNKSQKIARFHKKNSLFNHDVFTYYCLEIKIEIKDIIAWKRLDNYNEIIIEIGTQNNLSADDLLIRAKQDEKLP